MMNTRILLSLWVLLGLFACKKESQSPTPILLTDIIGSVNLYDEGTSPVSNSGLVVSILDSDPLIKAITNDQGAYELKEVLSGSYSLIFRKPGYGTYKVYDIIHDQTENTYLMEHPSLGQKTTTSVGFLIANVSNDSLILSVSIDPDATPDQPRYCRVFFGDTQDLSPEKFVYYTAPLLSINNPFELKFSSAEIQSYGFQKGQSVFVNVAGESYFSNEYYDPYLERQIFPNLFWTSGIEGFIVP